MPDDTLPGDAHGDGRTAAPDHGDPQRTTDAAPLRRVVGIADRGTSVPDAALEPWNIAVAASPDACLVLDADGLVVTLSDEAADLLGTGDESVVGRPMLEIVDVVDLDTGASSPEYAPRIPPLAALSGPGLVRSMLRIRHYDDTLVAIDCAAAPIHDGVGEVAGSISFLRAVRAG
jgi:PAS domain-containing protein